MKGTVQIGKAYFGGKAKYEKGRRLQYDLHGIDFRSRRLRDISQRRRVRIWHCGVLRLIVSCIYCNCSIYSTVHKNGAYLTVTHLARDITLAFSLAAAVGVVFSF